MADFKAKFSPTGGLTSLFAGSSPQYEMNGSPNIRDMMLAEQQRFSSPSSSPSPFSNGVANNNNSGLSTCENTNISGMQQQQQQQQMLMMLPTNNNNNNTLPQQQLPHQLPHNSNVGNNHNNNHGHNNNHSHHHVNKSSNGVSTGGPSVSPSSTILVDNRKFDFNSWLTNKSFLGLISVVALIFILIIGFILINKNNSKQKNKGQKGQKGQGEGQEEDDNEIDINNVGKKNNSNNSNNNNLLKGIGGGSLVAGASAVNRSLSSSRMENEISNHSSDIKFLMAQHIQLVNRIHQLEGQRTRTI
jgi:hypothetical protein